jgi:hypothetical protein
MLEAPYTFWPRTHAAAMDSVRRHSANTAEVRHVEAEHGRAVRTALCELRVACWPEWENAVIIHVSHEKTKSAAKNAQSDDVRGPRTTAASSDDSLMKVSSIENMPQIAAP